MLPDLKPEVKNKLRALQDVSAHEKHVRARLMAEITASYMFQEKENVIPISEFKTKEGR